MEIESKDEMEVKENEAISGNDKEMLSEQNDKVRMTNVNCDVCENEENKNACEQ